MGWSDKRSTPQFLRAFKSYCWFSWWIWTVWHEIKNIKLIFARNDYLSLGFAKVYFIYSGNPNCNKRVVSWPIRLWNSRHFSSFNVKDFALQEIICDDKFIQKSKIKLKNYFCGYQHNLCYRKVNIPLVLC